MKDEYKDIFEKTRADIDEMLEKFKKGVVENSKTVQDGVNTPEEELQEPGNLIFIKTYETVSDILKHPPILQSFVKVSDVIGEDAARDLAIGIVGVSAHSAYQSMVFYDGILRDELVKQFDMMVKQINMLNSEVIGLKTTISAQQKKISVLENKSKADEIKNSYH